MKHFFLLFICLNLTISSSAQNSLVRLDAASGRFKNIDYLPCCTKLTVEGEISRDVVYTELSVAYEGTEKYISTSGWTRTLNNLSESYEIQIQEQLVPNTAYDFTFRTFVKLKPEQKEQLKQNLLTRIHQYLKQNITIDHNKIKVDGPSKVFKELNTIIYSAIDYQRSLNGIQFEGLSDIVKDELKDLNELSLRLALKKKKRNEKYDVTEKILSKKIKEILELVYSEVFPFLSSELAQQNNLIEINGVDTEKMRSTLPINAGAYAFSTTQKIDNISEKNSGILPGAGITIPFTRPFKVKNYKIGEFGLSFGVLFNSIQTQSGVEYGIPGIKLPIYAGLGFKTFKVIRINAGTLFTTDLANPSKLRLMPTFGINLELNLWLGVKRY